MSSGELGAAGLPETFGQTAANALAAIGLRIREARLARNLTLQDLADAVGLSTSMISLVERGRASPSIGSLIAIASALDVAMSDLVASEPLNREGPIVRRGEAVRVYASGDLVRHLLREDRARGLSIAINEYEPQSGSAEKPMSHPGYEYSFVLEGCLSVEIEGKTFILDRGDLISFSSKRQHRIWNHGSKLARTIWISMSVD